MSEVLEQPTIAIPCNDCPNRKSNSQSDDRAVRLSASGNIEYKSTTTGQTEVVSGPTALVFKEAVRYCRRNNLGKDAGKTGDCPAMLGFFDDKSPKRVTQTIERIY